MRARMRTSELETRGNLIFTYALLRCNETEAIIPAKMFSQSFMTACPELRKHSTDKAVGYDPCAVCLRYMTEAKIHVGHVPVYDFSYLTQLINTLGRRMNTMMINSLWMHMEKRQYRAIKETIQASFTESSFPIATFRKSDDEDIIVPQTEKISSRASITS
jgi:cytidine deaminase